MLPADCAPELDDLTRVLRELVTQSRRLLGSNYVGAYLQGSVAEGAADLESDCDFLIVVHRPLTAAAFSDLAALHASLPRRPGHWSRHLEGSYPVAAALATLSGLGAGWAYVGHGSAVLERDSTHGNTPVLRRILLERGITLDGPAAKTLVEPIPDEVIRGYSRRQLVECLRGFESWSTKDAWSQRYSVLTVARLICSIETGQVVSKGGAARWASRRLDPHWRPLVEHVLARRGSTPYADPPDYEWVEQTHAFGELAKAWTNSE